MEKHNYKFRNPGIVALFNLLSPGLGFLYLGRLELVAIAGLIAIFLSVISMYMIKLSATWLLISLFIGVAYLCCLTLLGWRLAKQANSMRNNISKWQAWYYYLAYNALFVVTINLFLVYAQAHIASSYRIATSSMLPTFQVGDRFIASKGSVAPRRGDLVTFFASAVGDSEFVQRVIGLPGETVRMDGRHISINGIEIVARHIGEYVVHDPYGYDKDEKAALFEEKYREECVGSMIYLSGRYEDQTEAVLEVPVDSVFVLGDNRNNVSDSRVFGFIPISRITGRGEYLYWPPSRFGKPLYNVPVKR